ncbi:MAG: type I DNA topoisomerase [Spirochaetes bacterium]|nr:type I DNA topoisomerase [Spirochaetota bacterium]
MATEKKKKKVKKNGNTTLVIVESPAKAKTINKYLGAKYEVTASMGHLIDLPKSRLGVKVENDFEPEYITVRGKGKIVTGLKKKAATSKEVLLASDNDREGEAIAYHIQRVLSEKYPQLPIQRIVFNEITKPAILNAIKSPQSIDADKIEAQKTRRILDRLVGYNISPILWEKVKNGLSAGRVQSLALRVICEREAQIDRFIPEEYWTLSALFSKNKKEFLAELAKVDGKKPELPNKKAIDNLLSQLDNDNFIVDSITNTSKSTKPIAPFITSKLQQAAASKFNFTSRKTMQIAQQLYEGIDIGKDTIGLITYMRTDSTRISEQALAEVRELIGEKWPEFLPESVQNYTKKSGAQDAHEAIRPTSTMRTPELMKKYLTTDQYKIYSIIWERFVSSQMTPAVYETKTIQIKNGPAIFKLSHTKLTNKGFTASLSYLKAKEGKKQALPALKEGEKVDLVEFKPEQHFTQPPPRYTDASIIKFLEENGIGRPSTYAPTISTLLDRYYVVRKARQIMPTVLGKLVNDLIIKAFPEIVDVEFTAKMEQMLDEVANGQKVGNKILQDFYNPFKKEIDQAADSLESHKKAFDEETDEICEKCGSKMIKKLGRYGFFLACSSFPECRNSRAIPLADCPKDDCDGKIIARKKAKRGKEFYGCTRYPDCDFVTWFKPTEFKCPQCKKFLVEKNDKVHGTYKACVDDQCGYKQLEEHNEDTE